ncbi:amino acid adenylation domain-containing protein [uncultured Gilliamella sp.]|uniref:amino acid adenylation domain-containing protein n=1 Tax=uncultured Gilliamella sp. TaxID=1193505 RepID=UPI0025FBFD17|nr:amino acid adenylation domain-containing protein [uncultured Gilliamella sp.]
MKSNYPLMWSQQQCWIIEQLYPNSCINNIGGLCFIDGTVDVERLHKSMQSAIRHFDVLRMQFVQAEDGSVYSRVLPYQSRAIRHVTFTDNFVAQKSYPHILETFQTELFSQPFQLLESDLFELISFTCGEQQGGYFFKAHHAIVDGWSMSLLTDHIKWAYENPHEEWLDSLPPSYLNFLTQQDNYQASGRFAADHLWWQRYISEHIDCFPEKTPIVETGGISSTIWLAPDMIERIYRLCDNYKCSLNVLFIALFTLYRARVWGEEKGVIGIPLSNRFSREARSCFGMFTNHIPLAYRLDRDMTFDDLVMRLKTELENGFKHSKYPSVLFNQNLAEYGGNHLRAFDYCVNYYNFTYEREIMGLNQHVEAYYCNQQSYKLQLVLQTVNSHKESLKLCIEALSSEFEPRQLTALKNGLLDLINAIEIQPQATLLNLQVYNTPSHEIDGGTNRRLFNELFHSQIEKNAKHVAIRDNGVDLTYQQLSFKVEQMAKTLVNKGFGQGCIIGIAAERSADTVIAILGVLRCGAAFLPLNPDLPVERLRLMCDKTKVSHILYDIETSELVKKLDYSAALLSDIEDTIDVTDLPLSTVNAANLAYILFTSGSTGEPKGVQVTHGNLANYLDFAIKQYFTTEDEVPLYSSLSFDLTITSLFATLGIGACINVCRREENEALLRRAIVEQPNTFIKLTPAHLRLICVAEMGSQLIRTVVVGGEDFKLELAHKAAAQFPNATIYNEYGPTEATVGCMIYRYTGKEKLNSVPIGHAIAGCHIDICSPWGCLVPLGESGELVIYGESVTQGYIAAPKQTSAVFLYDKSNTKIIGYRSGDIGYAIDSDTLVYVGRADNQVKINGYRIELSEIEHVLLNAPQVTAMAVSVANDVKGNPCALLAWVTPENVNIQSIMQYMREKLPSYMIPQQCIAMNNLPLSLNGKVDLQQLIQTDGKFLQTVELKADEHLCDETIYDNVRDIVKKVLEQQKLADNENLYFLGLDSIKSIQIAADLRKLGWSIPTAQVMGCGTVKKIGDFIASHHDFSSKQSLELSNLVNLPAVHWFNHLDLANHNFYNHVIILDICLPCSFAEIEQCLIAIITQQPALRSRLNYDGSLTISDISTCYPSGVLKTYFEKQQSLDQVINEVNQVIDVSNGQVFTAAYFQSSVQENDKLILCAHHLAVDIHSWYLILSALDAPLDTSQEPNQGLQKWSQYLATKLVDPETQRYWETLNETVPPSLSFTDNIDVSLPYTQIWCEEFRHICVGRLLLSDGENSPREAETRLLTALAPVLSGYSNDTSCRIDMEGVGRGCWADEPDISDTIGWFTAFYPCIIPLSNDFAALLPDIRLRLAQRPYGGGDYGVLQMHNQLDRHLKPRLRFNYIGMGVYPTLTHFQIDHQRSTIYSAPENHPGCTLELNLSLRASNNLSFYCRFDPRLITLNEVQHLIARYKNNLISLDIWLRQQSNCNTTKANTLGLWGL